MAGKVAPMANVAGSKTNRGTKNASAQCQLADGSAPIHRDKCGRATGDKHATSKAQTAIKASRPAYQRPGCALRSRRWASNSEPAEIPPKKAAMTESTAMISWPSARANCAVQTICHTNPAAPDANMSRAENTQWACALTGNIGAWGVIELTATNTRTFKNRNPATGRVRVKVWGTPQTLPQLLYTSDLDRVGHFDVNRVAVEPQVSPAGHVK